MDKYGLLQKSMVTAASTHITMINTVVPLSGMMMLITYCSIQ